MKNNNNNKKKNKNAEVPRGASTDPLQRFTMNHSLASELSLIASTKIYWGPHNLVCPGAPTGLNPALARVPNSSK